VVASRTGGIPEALAFGGGILVERRSAVELASALRRLAESPELRTRLGQQGYAAFLERFTWSNTRTQVQQIQNAFSV
jgi:glycosyltransferase involved in cell wall biosynthesis